MERGRGVREGWALYNCVEEVQHRIYAGLALLNEATERRRRS